MHQRLESPYWALRLGFGVVPIAAGLDKFTNLLVDWTTYLSPLAKSTLPVSPATFMGLVGVILNVFTVTAASFDADTCSYKADCGGQGVGISLGWVYQFMGVMIGISFFLLNNVFGHIGRLNQWQPWLAAAAPSLIYSVVSLTAFGWLVLRR